MKTKTKNPIKILGLFIAVLAMFIAGGTLVAFGGAAGVLVTPAVWAAVPDAYGSVPGSFVNAEAAGGSSTPGAPLKQLSVTIAATVFGATCKLQGSNDATAIGNGTWTDLTTETAAGVANIVDVAIAAGAVGVLMLEDVGGTAGASAGLNFKAYRVQAKNTVGASVASVAVSIFGE